MFDWKTKFCNKTFVVSFTTAIVAFIYQILAICDIVPKISRDVVMETLMLIINLLTTLGIIVNPNTKGIADEDTTTKQ